GGGCSCWVDCATALGDTHRSDRVSRAGYRKTLAILMLMCPMVMERVQDSFVAIGRPQGPLCAGPAPPGDTASRSPPRSAAAGTVAASRKSGDNAAHCSDDSVHSYPRKTDRDGSRTAIAGELDAPSTP